MFKDAQFIFKFGYFLGGRCIWGNIGLCSGRRNFAHRAFNKIADSCIVRQGLFLLFITCIFQSEGTATSLDELIYQGLQSYPSVLSRQSSRKAAQSDLTAAKLKFLPNTSFNTQRNQVAYDGRGLNNLPATGVTISQPLFLDGAIIAGYNKADARLSAADFALLETREDISKRIINNYVEWSKAYLKIQALEESVKLHERFAGMISRRYEQGVASGADKDLGTSRFMQAKADLDAQRSIGHL